MWHSETVRAREADLLFAGGQFRQAIRSYYESSPGAARSYPRSVEDLLEDKRLPTVRRHLRRLWRDPFTHKAAWGFVRLPDGQITGVHSLADGVPRRTSGFPEGMEGFEGAATYRDWVFTWQPGVAAAAGGVPGGADIPGTRSPSTDGTQLPAVAEGPAVVPRDPARREPRECAAERVSDLAACRAAGSFADGDLVQRCAASATARFRACLSGTTAPALDTGK